MFIELTLTAGKKKILINSDHVVYVFAVNDNVGSRLGTTETDGEYIVDESYEEVKKLIGMRFSLVRLGG